MARTTVGEIDVKMLLNSKEFENKVKSILKKTEGQISSSGSSIQGIFGSAMGKVGGYIASAFAVTKVLEFSVEAIDAASRVQSAWTGLNSIVSGTGNSFSQAKSFIEDFTKDGLLTINEAATAYKNLLARGYDTTQIENTMKALKDSAAFGRQANYDLGEAVVSATEGLKNENSILVDNAGVTKNVAKMWQDWANAHGTTTSAMTQAQKIQAEYNGIMQETKFQMGDAAVYTKTFGGQMQMLKASFTSLKIAVGQVIAPIVQIFLPVINSIINALTSLFQKIRLILKAFGLEMPDVVTKASSGIANIGTSSKEAAKDAVKSAKKITKAFASVDEINVMQKPTSSSSGSGISSGGSTDIGSGISSTIGDVTDTTLTLSSTMEKIIEILKPIWNIISDIFGLIKEAVLWLVNMYTTYLAPVVEKILGLLGKIFEFIGIIWDTAFPVISSIVGAILESLEPTIRDLCEIIGEIIDALSGVMDFVIGVFTGDWERAWTGIKDFFDGIVSAIGTLFSHVFETISSIASNVWTSISNVWSGVSNWFNEKVVQPVGNFFTNMWQGLKNGAKGAWEGIKNTFSTVASFFKNIFTKAWEGVKSVFSTGGKIFSGITEGILKGFKAIVNTIITGINKVVSVPFSGINWALNKIKNVDILGIEPFSWIPTISIPQIPLLAQGDWVPRNSPQLAIIGDNTREGEIVSPESKIKEQVDKSLDEHLGRVGNQDFNFTFLIKYEDGRQVIKKINQAQIEAGEVLLMV